MANNEQIAGNEQIKEAFIADFNEALAKVDEDQLVATDGDEAGGWTWTIPIATMSICPTSACTHVC